MYYHAHTPGAPWKMSITKNHRSLSLSLSFSLSLSLFLPFSLSLSLLPPTLLPSLCLSTDFPPLAPIRERERSPDRGTSESLALG